MRKSLLEQPSLTPAPIAHVHAQELVAMAALIALGLAIALRRWAPALSGIASLAASFMFLLTFSFFFTTPGATAPNSEVGGFLMKDLILLGGSLAIAAEALGAASRLGKRSRAAEVLA